MQYSDDFFKTEYIRRLKQKQKIKQSVFNQTSYDKIAMSSESSISSSHKEKSEIQGKLCPAEIKISNLELINQAKKNKLLEHSCYIPQYHFNEKMDISKLQIGQVKLQKSQSTINIKKNVLYSYKSSFTTNALKPTPYQLIHSHSMMERKRIEDKIKNNQCEMKKFADNHFRFFVNKKSSIKCQKIKLDYKMMKFYFNKYTLNNPRLSSHRSCSIPSSRSQERKMKLNITKLNKTEFHLDKGNYCNSSSINKNPEDVFYNQGD